MADFDVDLAIIGGGSGGVRAARVAASYGAKVIVAEGDRVGGTCVIRGCVPKKLMVYASDFQKEIGNAAGFGWSIPSAKHDWEVLTGNIDREVARLEAAYTSAIEKSGARLVKERATFQDARTLRLSNGETVRARNILIATGSTPNHGEVLPGLEHVISSDKVFELRELPRRIIIQGGGYIAVEFACIFAGLGSKVTLVCRSDNILRGFDKDIRTHVRDALEQQEIRIVTGCQIKRVDRINESSGVLKASLSNTEQLIADQIMFAIGRKPNTQDLNLQRSGVALSADSGGVAVNENSQTNVPHIYAVGDVTNRVNLTPVAVREAQAFADSVFGKRPTQVDYTDIPTAVFSRPEVGSVGLSEAQARARFERVDIYKTDFRPMKVALSHSSERMMMKLVVDGDSGRVVGCHIVGSGAAEIIQAVAIAIRMKAVKEDFDATMALHPTAAEELVTMRTATRRCVRSSFL